MTSYSQLGVMQGRLLPKYKGRYQALPVGYWQNEFDIAASLNLNLIEFIFDYDECNSNPLFSRAGLQEISQKIKSSGVSVKSVCADYFMEAPLHDNDPIISNHSISIFEKLIENSSIIGISDVVLPCVDQSSIADEKCQDRLIGILKEFEFLLKKRNIRVSLEADLAPTSFANLLDRIASNYVWVNYDTGNSASLGFDPDEEFIAYGSRISDVHIKDRTIGGGPVMLGLGDAKLSRIKALLEEYNYPGPVIFQAYRDDEGLGVFKKQLDYWRNLK